MRRRAGRDASIPPPGMHPAGADTDNRGGEDGCGRARGMNIWLALTGTGWKVSIILDVCTWSGPVEPERKVSPIAERAFLWVGSQPSSTSIARAIRRAAADGMFLTNASPPLWLPAANDCTPLRAGSFSVIRRGREVCGHGGCAVAGAGNIGFGFVPFSIRRAFGWRREMAADSVMEKVSVEEGGAVWSGQVNAERSLSYSECELEYSSSQFG